MKLLTLTAVALIGMAACAQAQSTGVGVGIANSGSSSQSQSGAVAGGGNVNYTVNGARELDYSGAYDIRNVPAVTAPGFSSGHPCAYAPLSLGASIVGAGASAGGQKVDDACLLAQMGFTKEAMAMIAARNPSARAALQATGRVATTVSAPAASGSTKAQPKSTAVAMEVKCVGNVPHVTAKVAKAYSRAQLVAACK